MKKEIIIAVVSGAAVAAVTAGILIEKNTYEPIEAIATEAADSASLHSDVAVSSKELLTGKGEISGRLVTRNAVSDLKDYQTHSEAGGCVIDYCFLDSDIIEVPEQINGETVTAIGRFAFARRAARQIILPDSVTRIETAAFMNCENLENLHLGVGVKSVETKAFAGCHMLKNMAFPSGAESIAEFVFVENEALGEITLPGMTTKASNISDSYTCPNAIIVTPTGSEADKSAKAENRPVKNI